jgi:hypothetical protein
MTYSIENLMAVKRKKGEVTRKKKSLQSLFAAL